MANISFLEKVSGIISSKFAICCAFFILFWIAFSPSGSVLYKKLACSNNDFEIFKALSKSMSEHIILLISEMSLTVCIQQLLKEKAAKDTFSAENRLQHMNLSKQLLKSVTRNVLLSKCLMAS